MYKDNAAMYMSTSSIPKGFEWVSLNHRNEGVMVYRRKGKKPAEDMVIILNVTKENYPEWKLELKGKTSWKEVYNSNNIAYWGNGEHVSTAFEISPLDKKEKVCEIKLALPALSAMILR